MNTRIDIIHELEQLQSPLAAQVPVNVFTVPQGYFEGLAASVLRAVQGDHILQTIQPPANAEVPEGYFDNLAGNILSKIKAQATDDEPLSPLLESLRKTNVFTVPEGYFEGLSENILANAAAENLSPILESLRKTNVFTVPEGYFEGLSENILANAAAENLSPLLESLRKTNVFTVPEGYFEGLSEGVLAGQSAEDIQLHPILADLRQQQVFTVPQGYFEALPGQIAAKLPQPKGKLVGFVRSRFVKYAAAAVVVGAMALGGYQFIKGGTTDEEVVKLAALTDVQKQGIALSKNDALYNKELEQVSSEAIVQFLTANGDDLESSLAAAAVSEDDLPNEVDLILDDEALDNFLNNNDNSSKN